MRRAPDCWARNTRVIWAQAALEAIVPCSIPSEQVADFVVTTPSQ